MSGEARPSIREVREWLAKHGVTNSPKAILRAAEHLEETGRALDSMRLIETHDSSWDRRQNRTRKESRSIRLTSKVTGGVNIHYFLAEAD